MSGLYENQKTIRQLKAAADENKPKDGESIFYFVLGYPRSDIGKGTLVAQLLHVTENSDAIKFDGLLNTNKSGRHTASGHDDFGIYESFNSGRSWGQEHYLLGGELYKEFIEKYGENENLQINPHLSFFVESKLYKIWYNAGKPRHFFIEVGGLITDPEVGPIFTPIIQRLQDNGIGRVILLTELQYGDYIKTKTIQDAYRTLLSRRISPWLLVMCEPLDIGQVSEDERLEFERVVSTKLSTVFNRRLLRIISVPHFQNICDYTDYMKRRFSPLVSNVASSEIFVASNNVSKLDDYRIYLGDDYHLLSPKTEHIKIDILEGIDSIEDNAIAKARAYAIKTGKVSIGDDTGFFIKDLNGEPGVALRRWGGELPESTSNEAFWKFLQEKTKDLKNYDCYFKQCVAIVSPKGDSEIVYNINNGFLNKEKLQRPYNNSGYPIGAAFESYNRNKTWDEMTDSEKKEFDKQFIGELKTKIKRVLSQ